MQYEFQARNIIKAAINKRTRYINFPRGNDETKRDLSLKSFYSWCYMARKFGDGSIVSNDDDSVSSSSIRQQQQQQQQQQKIDYIMKVDPDTYMIMNNYLQYLASHYHPSQHVYIGRVFKTNGNHNEPFVTGLSVTLSITTAQLAFVDKSRMKENEDLEHYECTAEAFMKGNAADDYILSRCLSSLGIYPAYTRDTFGRERFLHFNPSDHVYHTNEEPEWYKLYSFTPHNPRSGCCSNEACAFHYVDLKRMNDTLLWDEVFGVWHWQMKK